MSGPVQLPVNDFRALWSRGYRSLLPIVPPGSKLSLTAGLNPNSLGKIPGVKLDDGWTGLPGWQNRQTTESDVDVWSRMGAGVGIRCENGLCAIDVDTLNDVLAATISERVEARLGPLPLRIGQAPKHLFLCRTTPSYKHPDLVFDGGEIEVRTSGQFVACGTHPKTNAPYRWVRSPPPIAELPFAAPETLSALFEELREALPKASLTSAGGKEPTDPESLRGSLADVAKAVALIPNDYASRRVYLKMGYALRAALPDDLGEARTLFQEWCARWDDPEGEGNDPETVDRDFDSFVTNDKQTGWGWIKREADFRSGGRFTIEANFERVKPDGIDPTPYSFPDPSKIPVRASLYGGHYVRKFLSATIAQSKVGKSTLVLVEALAMASGKPLLGVRPSGKLRVWWWNGEDPHEELERRVAAAMKHYGLTRDDIEDRLLINSGREMPIILATQGRGGAIVDQKTVDALCSAIQKNKIDVTIADPFISLHRVSENDNGATDVVAKTGALIAERTDSSFEAVHHSRKLNGLGAVVEDARGASSLLGATRSMRALSKMSPTEALKFGIGAEYRSLFRFSDVSSNMSPPSADEDEKWMQIVSVNLENGEGDSMDRLMKGDKVGVARVYSVRNGRESAFKETITQSREDKALAEIGANEWRKQPRASDWVGVPIAQAMGFDLETEAGKSATKSVLRLWLDQGKLVEVNRQDRYRHTRTFIVLGEKQVALDLFS